MSWVLAWVFSFPVVFNSSKSRIKTAGAGTAAVGVCCPEELALPWVQLCTGPAVSSSSLIWGGRGTWGDLPPWVQRYPKFTCLFLEVSFLNANVEESDSFKSRINLNLVHQNQELCMTWFVTGFSQAQVMVGVLLPSQLPARKIESELGFWGFFLLVSVWEV